MTSLHELINVIESATGKKAVREHLAAQPGDVRDTCADIAKARDFLGYNPTVPLGEGIRDFIQWFRKGSRDD